MTAVVGVEDELAGEELDVLVEVAVVVHRGVDIQAVLQAELVVLLAVSGGGVDTAGTGFQGHVLAQEDDGIPVVEGVPAVLLLQERRLEGGDDLAGRRRLPPGRRPSAHPPRSAPRSSVSSAT